MLIELAAETQNINWGEIILQSIITLGVVFGGAGFWEFVKTKFIAKREDKKNDDAVEAKVDILIEQSKTSKEQMNLISADMQEFKKDLALLQEANEATVKYREARDQKDRDAAVVQQAIIESITGLMRDRLLDNYKRCIKKGYYTMAEREIYGRMFECYEQPPFNGNGVMHDLRPVMKKLPMTAEEAGRLNDDDSDD